MKNYLDNTASNNWNDEIITTYKPQLRCLRHILRTVDLNPDNPLWIDRRLTRQVKLIYFVCSH